MTKIDLMASDQFLSVLSNPVLASGDKNTDTLHIDFSEEWGGLTLSAVFFTDKDTTVYEVVLDGNRNCIIPHELLVNDCVLFIGARGVGANSVKTSTLVKYKINRGSPSGTASSVDPTPDIYQQILANQESLKAETEAEIEEIREMVENFDGAGDLSKTDVVDNLLSTATNLPLSANQGKILNDKVEQAKAGIPTITLDEVNQIAYIVTNQA